jgi:polysaccharide export outer membrane protein
MVARGLRLAVVILIGFLSWAGIAQADDDLAYRVGPGDKLRMTIYGEDNLTGQYDVSDQGNVALPLIGQVGVGGKTLQEVQALIAEKYGANYLVNPRVSVEVLNYRPFFILGEVNKPGSYPYVSGLTVFTAVAVAGGFTPRADEKDILIKRANNPAETERRVSEDTTILPGDVIRVMERFF